MGGVRRRRGRGEELGGGSLMFFILNGLMRESNSEEGRAKERESVCV